jgi:hypothetical protein
MCNIISEEYIRVLQLLIHIKKKHWTPRQRRVENTPSTPTLIGLNRKNPFQRIKTKHVAYPFPMGRPPQTTAYQKANSHPGNDGETFSVFSAGNRFCAAYRQ